MLCIFDVDGTLTPSRGRIDETFRLWLLNNFKLPYVLITGSDPDKTREQIGDELYDGTVVYNCTGNHVFDHGEEVRRSDWQIPDDLHEFLELQLATSRWNDKTGRHIEPRVGLCNFSVLGRNAQLDQRHAYYQYDRNSNERKSIAAAIMHRWPDVEASVAGETGIDIYARGMGKSQIVEYERGRHPYHFFGDRMDPAGNDYSLAKVIWDNNLGECHHVANWQETWNILRTL
jgi:phosphomannomutase